MTDHQSLSADDIAKTSRLLEPGHNAPMHVEMVPTKDLKVDSESARTFSREDIKSAKRILKRFDVRMPLVADADDCVLIGEILLVAAQELDIEYLPVVRLDHLD